jgi:hypothetical protein
MDGRVDSIRDLCYIFSSFLVLRDYRYCPAIRIRLKVVSFDRSLLIGEAQRFLVNFALPPSSESPLKY